ncbi:MAG: adenylate/guanylate cyclase domain-containing protein [Oscillospiraceae bacterium]|nr:adenylate/guanylate cyclase domain-containing protein [Oscillospiraceae bacterium]
MYKKLTVLMPLFLLIVFGLLMAGNVFRGFENWIYDNFLQREREPLSNIIIVGIDERSIEQIGTFPWPRRYMAQAVTALLDNGVATVGIDVLYDSHGVNPEYDLMLIEAARSERVVFGTMGVFPEGLQEIRGRRLNARSYVTPFDELYEVATTGFLNVMPDSDGVIRKAIANFIYAGVVRQSFPLEVFRTYRDALGYNRDETLEIIESVPLDQFSRWNIDYVGRANSFTALSLWGVINDEYPPELFDDALVLIGAFAVGLGDNYFTAIDKSTMTFGVEIHANALQNLIEQNFKTDAQWYWNLIGLAFFGAVMTVLFSKTKPLFATIGAIMMVIAHLFIANVLYEYFDIIILSTYTLALIAVACLANLVLALLNVQHEKALIRGFFGRFVAEEVVNEIISGNVEVQLGGVLREVTVIFVDIRGFTAFSEANPPEQVVEMVNRFLNLTSRSIQQNGGTIDKYIGDATMAVFNAPTDLEDHALCAVQAAWAMKQGSLDLRESILHEFGVDLQFGIGINTGTVIAGNMGSDFRMDYTVIGDTVNTAARLEANAAKGQIIISQSVYERVSDFVKVHDLEAFSLKNKKDEVKVYEVVDVVEGIQK